MRISTTLLGLALTMLYVLSASGQTNGPNPGVNPVRQIDRAEVRVTRVELQPGAVRAVHTHDDVRFHLFIPVAGQLELTIGSAKPVEATPGQAFFMERGTPHGFRNAGSSPAMVMEVFVKDTGAAALAAPVATETMTYDHVHFGVPDQAKAVEWYAKYLGGQPGPAGEPNERLLFGNTRFIFLKNDKPLPSAGSSVDHIGISFADVAAKMKELEAAGVKVLTPIHEERGLFKSAFIEDPWGAKIEILQDPGTLGFHHVHLRAPDPEAAFQWYLDKFGGERTKLKGQVDALKYGEVWVLADKGEATPSEGHAIDHIGWRTTMDLNAKATELKAKGVKFTTEPTPVRNIHMSYVEGPAVVKIELLQR